MKINRDQCLITIEGRKFQITNGTRQGSVLSPYLFAACYLDDLQTKLRSLGLGCHIAGVWVGCCSYADDLALLAPNNEVLQKMVQICEEYGIEHNIKFSTDPNPSKSKTKCLLFCGKNYRGEMPAPVMLDGKELPWVNTVEHLGHVLDKTLEMDADVSRARASFMRRASDVRDQLSFATPDQRMNAINLYCCDAYGSMIWDLDSDSAESFYKAWNIQARYSWNISPMTHTYLVENYFCDNLKSLKNQVLGRYANFARKLQSSPSREIRFMYAILVNDARSQLYSNLNYLRQLTNVDPVTTNICEFKSLLPRELLPQIEQWRIRWLNVLLEARRTNNFSALNIDKDMCNSMLDSICIT